MNFLWQRNRVLYFTILAGFIVMAFIEFPLLNSALKGKEKDFNDKLFYLVASVEEQIGKDSALMNRIGSDADLVSIAQNGIKSKLQTAFINNGIPTNFVMGAGKVNAKDPALTLPALFRIWTGNQLIWTEDSSSNSGLIATKLKIGYLGPAGNRIYYLKVFFPHKQQFLLKELLPQILTMVVTLIMLFICFLLLLHVIIRQRVLAESKAAFITNMTHELQTPLFTISIASKMLAEQAALRQDEKSSSYISSIQEESGRLMNLVDKVLQASAADKERNIQNSTRVNVHTLLQSSIRRLQLIMQKQRVKVETFLQANPYNIQVNERDMEMVFVNIIDNAIKYAGEAARIVISTINQGDKIIISIADNGPGIGPEIKELIFEKFFRVPSGNLHNVRGYGIGLNFSKSVIEAHNGSIRVKSSPGKGSEFIISLPCSNE